MTLLQSLVLNQCPGIDAAALAAGGSVAYTREAAEAAARVGAGEAQAAFLLPHPRCRTCGIVSPASDTLPQKSTFFPKLLSGLLLRDLSADSPADALTADED